MTATQKEMDAPLRSRGICFFHTRGLPYPFQRRFFYSSEDVEFGLYSSNVPTNIVEVAEPTSRDMISVYCLSDDNATTENPTAASH